MIEALIYHSTLLLTEKCNKQEPTAMIHLKHNFKIQTRFIFILSLLEIGITHSAVEGTIKSTEDFIPECLCFLQSTLNGLYPKHM